MKRFLPFSASKMMLFFHFFIFSFQKLPESLFIEDMAPAPTDSMSSTTLGGVASKATGSFQIPVIPTDHNDNFLEVNGEELFNHPTADGSNSDGLYTSVDKQFLELMLDAVHKGFMPPELASAKTWLNSDAAEEHLDASGHLLNAVVPSTDTALDGQSNKGMEKDQVEEVVSSEDAVDEEKSPVLDCTGAIPVSGGPSLPSVEPTLSEEPFLVSTEPTTVAHEPSDIVGPSLTSLELPSTSDGSSLASIGPSSQVGGEEDRSEGLEAFTVSGAGEPAASTPNKKVQFLGLDNVFGKTSNSADEPVDISFSPSHPANNIPEAQLMDGREMSRSSPKTVTWATLDSPIRTPRIASSSTAKSLSSPAEGKYRFEIAHYGAESDATSEGDLDDPFMLYLNSIEQTALKFKLQVEQAKVDTLEALKEKLERAYEGTPLEEIPLKFREKLQDTISEIASDEVLKKYQALVTQDEEMSEEENAILECMRKELDSVACENFELHQQLELLRDYEGRYFELKENFDNLNNGMLTIRNEYQKKNGESEFLAERVESLEKSIVNLRVEYNNEIRDLQNENLQLQKTCLELENKNKILEEEISANCEGFSGSQADENVRKHERSSNKKSVIDQEFEMLQLRLEESEKQNSALRAASQADQAMMQCVEEKREELEKALAKAQDDHSSVLLELHEAQRQISSDRVKLSSYQEEVDALQRENKLLKSSLEIAQSELEYQVEKRDTKDEPWKNNKRMIWREIRELEKILKDVHREKRNIEKKYVTFKQESDMLNGSLSLHSISSSENSPAREANKDDKEQLKSKSWHSATDLENNKTSLNGPMGDIDDEGFSSSPRKVKSWLDGLHTPNGMVRGDLSFHQEEKERTPNLSERYGG